MIFRFRSKLSDVAYGEIEDGHAKAVNSNLNKQLKAEFFAIGSGII
jgi:hypothetical protein